MRERQVVVVTGASAGVGRAVVREFARRGAAIGLLARDAERLERTAREVDQLGGCPLILPVDVADATAVDAAAGRIEGELGRIDIWVNNAMTSVFAPVSQMEPEEYRRVTEVTYLGYVYSTQAALRRMTQRDHGMIVQVGSALAYRGIPVQSAYCAAKHAIKGFTESLRIELLHDASHIKISMVELLAVSAPQFEGVRNKMPNRPQPVPPIYQPEVAAEAIVWAADNAPRELLVGLPTMLTVTSNKAAPCLVDRYLAATGFQSQQTEEGREPRPDNLWEPVRVRTRRTNASVTRR